MAICSICDEKSLSVFMVEYNRPVCKNCMREAGLLTKFGFFNMKRAVELCDGKPTVEGIRQAIYPSIEQNHINYRNNDYSVDKFDNVFAVDGMEGHEFEYFCADLLRNNGFSEVSVTRGSGDQGVDILATKGGVKYAIQCKNYVSALGNTPVQEVSAGKFFYNCHVGVVLTNSTFTQGAISLAKATGVLLWDRTVLSDLMGKNPSLSENSVASTDNVPMEISTPIAPQPQTNPVIIPSTPDVTPYKEVSELPKQQKHITIDNITIEIDTSSINQFGILLDNFGVEMDEEDDEDQIELLFDLHSKTGRAIPYDLDIVFNLYAGNRKIITERETVYKDSFHGRDSLCVYFDKKRVCKLATRIEIFCQKW